MIFSKGEGKQVYAITVKVLAIVVAIRKLIPDLEENASLTFRGKLLAEGKAIVYDLTAGEPIKRRAKRKTAQEVEADEAGAEVDAAEGAAEGTATLQREAERRTGKNTGRYAARNTVVENKCLVFTEKVTRQAFCFD